MESQQTKRRKSMPHGNYLHSIILLIWSHNMYGRTLKFPLDRIKNPSYNMIPLHPFLIFKIRNDIELRIFHKRLNRIEILFTGAHNPVGRCLMLQLATTRMVICVISSIKKIEKVSHLYDYITHLSYFRRKKPRFLFTSSTIWEIKVSY